MRPTLQRKLLLSCADQNNIQLLQRLEPDVELQNFDANFSSSCLVRRRIGVEMDLIGEGLNWSKVCLEKDWVYVDESGENRVEYQVRVSFD